MYSWAIFSVRHNLSLKYLVDTINIEEAFTLYCRLASYHTSCTHVHETDMELTSFPSNGRTRKMSLNLENFQVLKSKTYELRS